MPFKDFTCCNVKIKKWELWLLEDFKGYTGRKLFVGKCKICGDEVCLQIMTNVGTSKTYYNFYTGLEAVKTIYKEKRRKIATYPDIKSNSLYGWIYGVNVELKDKKGKTSQIRQYASDFKGNKKIIKKINTN